MGSEMCIRDIDCSVCAPLDQPHTCIVVVREKTNATTGKKAGFETMRADTATCPACQPTPKHACTRRGVKIHMDLKDFFGSTRRSWIRKYFQDVVGYNHYVSNLLSTAMTVELVSPKGKKRNGVPQGSPTSGDICNLVADWKLDQPVLKALEGTGWKYSRYADDLYISHPKNLSPDAVNQTIQLMDSLVRKSGYVMNHKKLHVQRPHRRQQLLGVVLNQKVNIPLDAYRRMRAILHNVYFNGFEKEAERSRFGKASAFINYLGGRISYMQMVNHHKADRLRQMFDLARTRWKADAPASALFIGGVLQPKPLIQPED